MYGGGMGENGVARREIQLLASIFHPEAPNDVRRAATTPTSRRGPAYQPAAGRNRPRSGFRSAQTSTPAG